MTDPVPMTWRDIDGWRCPECDYDATEREKVVLHIAYAHPDEQPPTKTAPVSAIAVDTRQKRTAKDATATKPASMEVNNGATDAGEND